MATIDVTADEVMRALEPWDWLNFNGLEPFLVSSFGDIFFEDRRGVFFLDTVEGTLERIAVDRTELAALLSSETGKDTYLLDGLAIGAEQRGMHLQRGECYDFAHPPCLGGEISLDNVHKMTFLLKVHLAGQVHKQVKDLPPGTVITEFVTK